MEKFSSRLNYSFGNEDSNTESKALKIQPNHRLMCITASGDRPLHLLLDNPKEVVSVDINESQNHLLNLKKAALQNLDYDHYLSFLGLSPDPLRNETFNKITSYMDPDSIDFWQQRKKWIDKGVIYQGAIEKITAFTSTCISLLRKSKVKRLFEFDDIQEQAEFVQKEWNTYIWKTCLDLATHPFISKLFINDPGLYSNISPKIRAGSYILERMTRCLTRHLAKENSFISLFFKGSVGKEAYPPYLTEEGINQIRSRLDRISIKTADVIHFLESADPQSFDAFSLSDVASYMPERSFHRLLRSVFQAAKNGSRFSIRQFLSGHDIPPDLKPFFHREPELENQLEAEDRCFVYRFMVGTISK